MEKHYEEEKEAPFVFHEKTIRIDQIINYGRRHQQNRTNRLPDFQNVESEPLQNVMNEKVKII